jgi:hypothetical protein
MSHKRAPDRFLKLPGQHRAGGPQPGAQLHFPKQRGSDDQRALHGPAHERSPQRRSRERGELIRRHDGAADGNGINHQRRMHAAQKEYDTHQQAEVAQDIDLTMLAEIPRQQQPDQEISRTDHTLVRHRPERSLRVRRQRADDVSAARSGEAEQVHELRDGHGSKLPVDR